MSAQRLLARLRQCLITACLLGGFMTISAPSFAEMSSSQAASKAKRAHGGKVLSVSKVSSKNGKDVYKVKLLLEGGRVKTVTVSG